MRWLFSLDMFQNFRALFRLSQILAQLRVVFVSRLRFIWSIHTSFQSISVIGFIVIISSDILAAEPPRFEMLRAVSELILFSMRNPQILLVILRLSYESYHNCCNSKWL